LIQIKRAPDSGTQTERSGLVDPRQAAIDAAMAIKQSAVLRISLLPIKTLLFSGR
jgi:hypothetical protein